MGKAHIIMRKQNVYARRSIGEIHCRRVYAVLHGELKIQRMRLVSFSMHIFVVLKRKHLGKARKSNWRHNNLQQRRVHHSTGPILIVPLWLRYFW